jgi:hypothetical protein
MKDGRYCEKCHPNGSTLSERHDDAPFDKVFMPYWGVCDKCKLLKALWPWVGDNDKEI